MEPSRVSEIDFRKFVFSSKLSEMQNLAKSLRYLPPDILQWVRDNVVYFTTYGKQYGSRLSRGICLTKEIITISEKTFPFRFDENEPATRFFIFIVLHETAHAWRKDRCRICDGISNDEYWKQEREATALALEWYNGYASDYGLPELKQENVEEYHAELDRIVDDWEEMWKRHLINLEDKQKFAG